MFEISPTGLKDSLSDRKSKGSDDELLRVNHLPIARVKRIMKESEHQGMISSEAPVILAKACELLVRDLTIQSWNCTRSTKRCTLQRQDITSAIFMSNIYNFLYDLLTPEDLEPLMETPKMNLYSGIGLNNTLFNQQMAFNKVSQSLCYPNLRKNSYQNSISNQSIDWTRFYRYSTGSLSGTSSYISNTNNSITNITNINNSNYTTNTIGNTSNIGSNNNGNGIHSGQNNENIVTSSGNWDKTSQPKDHDLNFCPLPYYGMSPNQCFVDQRLYPSESYNQMRVNVKEECYEETDNFDQN